MTTVARYKNSESSWASINGRTMRFDQSGKIDAVCGGIDNLDPQERSKIESAWQKQRSPAPAAGKGSGEPAELPAAGPSLVDILDHPDLDDDVDSGGAGDGGNEGNWWHTNPSSESPASPAVSQTRHVGDEPDHGEDQSPFDDSTFDFGANSPNPTRKPRSRSEIPAMQGRLGKAVEEMFPMDTFKQEAVGEIALETYKNRKEFNSRVLEQRQEAIGFLAARHGTTTAGMTNRLRQHAAKGGDADKIRYFDEVVDQAEKYWPELASGNQGDAESNTFQNIMRSPDEFHVPPPWSDEILAEALEEMDRQENTASDWEPDPEIDSLPFAKSGRKWLYRKLSRLEAYRRAKYAAKRQRTLFDAPPAPISLRPMETPKIGTKQQSLFGSDDGLPAFEEFTSGKRTPQPGDRALSRAGNVLEFRNSRWHRVDFVSEPGEGLKPKRVGGQQTLLDMGVGAKPKEPVEPKASQPDGDDPTDEISDIDSDLQRGDAGDSDESDDIAQIADAPTKEPEKTEEPTTSPAAEETVGDETAADAGVLGEPTGDVEAAATLIKGDPVTVTDEAFSDDILEYVRDLGDGRHEVRNQNDEYYQFKSGEINEFQAGRVLANEPESGSNDPDPSPSAEDAGSESDPDHGMGSLPIDSENPRDAARNLAESDPDYDFARKSTVPNAGEDLKGSARHKRNAWQSLEEAEADGTAAAQVTKANLLKNEPPSLMGVADESPLSAMAMSLAIRKFPPKPEYGRRGKTDAARAKKDREDYYSAYKQLVSDAEEIAEKHVDPSDALKEFKGRIRGLIDRLRESDSIYNNTANSLIAMHNGLRGRNATSVSEQVKDFVGRLGAKYGDVKSAFENIGDHAKDVIEGHSVAKAFGDTGSKGKPVFSAADMYVKTARRVGGRDINAETISANKAVSHLTENLGMRGVQWGNSVTDDERHHHSQRVAEAFTDLVDVLGLSDDDASLGGTLGIAIGARGHGNAMAHYEPGSQVINLTRKSGVGSLAHEWGHFFDHMLTDFKITSDGEKSGGDYYSERTSPKRLKKNGAGGVVMEGGKPVYINNDENPMWVAYNDLRTAMRDSGFNQRLGRELTGMGMKAKQREYWRSEREKFARSFERYIQRKLESKNQKNTYLSGVMSSKLWPTDEEVDAMAPYFDRIFELYKQGKNK